MTETTPEAREAVTYPVEERAFHVIRYTSDRDVDQFRASDRATLSSFPARDRDDAYAMAETLNRVVRFHVERAAALSPPAISEAVEAEREGCDGDGSHCCCCGPGDRCCDCGAMMPDREELPALRRALADLLQACRIADAKEDLSLDIDGELLDAADDALELQFPIIWTAEQVAQLNAAQEAGDGHPYTCGGDRSDAAHKAQAEEDGTDAGQLIATRRGWVCPVCDYRQFWAHGITTIRARTSISEVVG